MVRRELFDGLRESDKHVSREAATGVFVQLVLHRKLLSKQSCWYKGAIILVSEKKLTVFWIRLRGIKFREKTEENYCGL